ncbi:hypothetical protein CHS0354_015929 [Potamilus streckersoni]|uniref:Uncharacterized protein n=1 Tax=Potamilus streckersoni TaxID=2493646 RepID=A0AAE0W0C1_9BIVA|nr:hypothetical protein CHS0354_015929 [Potamilus streckersoni]
MDKRKIIRTIKLHDKDLKGINILRDYSNNLYPSSHWQSEAQSRYLPSTSEKEDNDKHNFLITSLDTRAHNPQSKRIFHIKRINHEPVCKVLTWPLDAEQSGEGIKTVYSTSYPIKIRKEPRRLILRHSLEKRAEGIVPINPAEGFDVRNEMMLPVCDPVVLPSAPNPHRYLIRKRKVPAPTKPAGVIYPPLEPKPIRSAEIMSKGPKSAPFERVSVSSLAGDIFSRRKYIPQPLANMTTDNQVRDLDFWCISSVKGLDASRRRFIRPPSCRVDLASGFRRSTSKK